MSNQILSQAHLSRLCKQTVHPTPQFWSQLRHVQLLWLALTVKVCVLRHIDSYTANVCVKPQASIWSYQDVNLPVNVCSQIMTKSKWGKSAVRGKKNKLCLNLWFSLFRQGGGCGYYRKLSVVVEISQVLRHALSLTSCFKRKWINVWNQIVALKLIQLDFKLWVLLSDCLPYW